MYYPYLRGNKSELTALRELAQKIASSGNITPIIEPVNLSTETLDSLREYQKVNMPFILIANPAAGKNVPDIRMLNEKVYEKFLKDYSCFKMGLIVNRRTSIKQVEIFIDSFKGTSLSLIHYEDFSEPVSLAILIAKSPNIATQVFMDEWTSRQYLLQVDMRTQTVIVRDCLNRPYGNSDYPDEEIFSDMHSIYMQSGYDGFGDFTVWGDVVREVPRGKAEIVVHFPYVRRKDKKIWIKHFIADANEKGMDKEIILPRLIEMIALFLTNNPSQIRTEGAKEIVDIHRKKSKIDFNRLKSIIIKHHIELVSEILF